MNIQIVKTLADQAEVTLNPGNEIRDVCGYRLPTEYADLFKMTGGIVSRRGIIRIFGSVESEKVPTIAEWNSSAWKASYGDLAADIIFIAEDIFGDQYGYSFRDRDPALVKFYCEGGVLNHIKGSLETLLKAFGACEESNIIDNVLVEQAFAKKLRPLVHEHLAFELPLILGGDYDVENLTVESSALHLGLLSQASLTARDLPDKTPIRRFTS